MRRTGSWSLSTTENQRKNSAKTGLNGSGRARLEACAGTRTSQGPAPGGAVPLSDSGAAVLLDAEDAAWASQWRWRLDGSGYPARSTWAGGKGSKRLAIRLHRAIAERAGYDLTSGRIVDHINGDVLDCRRSNLRVVDDRENQRNRHTLARGRRFRGVFAHKKVCRFEAALGCGEIQPNGKARRVSLGLFATEVEAAVAVDRKLDELGWSGRRNLSTEEERQAALLEVAAARAAAMGSASPARAAVLRRDAAKLEALRCSGKEAA